MHLQPASSSLFFSDLILSRGFMKHLNVMITKPLFPVRSLRTPDTNSQFVYIRTVACKYLKCETAKREFCFPVAQILFLPRLPYLYKRYRNPLS